MIILDFVSHILVRLGHCFDLPHQLEHHYNFVLVFPGSEILINNVLPLLSEVAPLGSLLHRELPLKQIHLLLKQLYLPLRVFPHEVAMEQLDVLHLINFVG